MCPQLVAKTKYIDTLIKLLLYLLTYLLTVFEQHDCKPFQSSSSLFIGLFIGPADEWLSDCEVALHVTTLKQDNG